MKLECKSLYKIENISTNVHSVVYYFIHRQQCIIFACVAVESAVNRKREDCSHTFASIDCISTLMFINIIGIWLMPIKIYDDAGRFQNERAIRMCNFRSFCSEATKSYWLSYEKLMFIFMLTLD